MDTFIKNIIKLLVGILGGILALIIAIFFELILSIIGGKPPLALAKDSFFLLTLLIPALLEEITKTAVATRLKNTWGSIWVIIGTGIGFGMAEIYLSQSAIPLKISSALLPVVHSIFLFGGYLIATKLAKGDRFFYFEWLIASTLLHWGYNVAQVAFLLKP